MNDRVNANKTQFPGGPAFRTDIDPSDGAHVQVNKIHIGDVDEFSDGYVGVNNPMPVTMGAPTFDAFGRLRVSDPETLFDSKQIFDNQPLFWDEATTGSGTSSTYSQAAARTRIAVSASTAGSVIRQTFMRFNYQPGKSQLIFMTGKLAGGGSGITAAMGLFDDDNGIFVGSEDGVLQVVRRTSTSGSAVDNAVAQADWNIDPMDGTGPSGYTLDPSNTQIFWIDLEWLGVGRVRCGWVIDGKIIPCHQFLNTNNLDVVYMSTPNLPLRYFIENDGTGPAAHVDHICATVISEGGNQNIGTLRYKSTAGTHIDANTANTIYGIIGIRLKTSALGSTIKLVEKSVLATTNDAFEWMIILNPTVAGTPSWSDETNSTVQTSVANNTNTVTGGTIIQGGFASVASAVTGEISNAILLGSAIDGTRDEIWLCARPLTSNSDIEGGLTWREAS